MLLMLRAGRRTGRLVPWPAADRWL